MQSVVTGQTPVTAAAAFFLLCSICTEYYEALLWWNTSSRCSDQIKYVTRTYVCLDFLRGECLYHRALGVWLFWYGEGEYMKNSVPWAFGCSDTTMVNIWRMVYRGSAYILLGRWIDANDHMYIENLAIDEKQCPPFCQRFGGVYPFLSSALKTYL